MFEKQKKGKRHSFNYPDFKTKKHILLILILSRGKLSFKQPNVIIMSNIIKQDVFEAIWICSVLLYFWMKSKCIARFLIILHLLLNLVLEVKFTVSNIRIMYLENRN